MCEATSIAPWDCLHAWQRPWGPAQPQPLLPSPQGHQNLHSTHSTGGHGCSSSPNMRLLLTTASFTASLAGSLNWHPHTTISPSPAINVESFDTADTVSGVGCRADSSCDFMRDTRCCCSSGGTLKKSGIALLPGCCRCCGWMMGICCCLCNSHSSTQTFEQHHSISTAGHMVQVY